MDFWIRTSCKFIVSQQHQARVPAGFRGDSLWNSSQNPDSDIELADEEREKSNIEPISNDSSLSDLKDDNDVSSAENYPLGENNFRKSKEHESLCFPSTAMYWHHWPAARCCWERYTHRFLEPHD